jgi:hypothetical protein
LLALRAGRAFPIPTNISWYSFPAIQDRVHWKREEIKDDRE